MLLQIAADLGGQKDAGAGAQFAVLFVEFALQHQLLEINKGHGHGGLLEPELLCQLPDLPLQTGTEDVSTEKRSAPDTHRGGIPAGYQMYIQYTLARGLKYISMVLFTTLIQIRSYKINKYVEYET